MQLCILCGYQRVAEVQFTINQSYYIHNINRCRKNNTSTEKKMLIISGNDILPYKIRQGWRKWGAEGNNNNNGTACHIYAAPPINSSTPNKMPSHIPETRSPRKNG